MGLLYWNIANVQPKQMAKHLIFFQTGVMRPGLMALPVCAAIATILIYCSSSLHFAALQSLYRMYDNLGNNPRREPS